MLLPDVPYHRTAVRPGWDELPVDVRAAIESRLGSPVVGTQVTATGFTPTFAGLVHTADGASHFVKFGMPAEARFSAVLPPSLPAPRLRWSEEFGDQIVLCFDVIEGARTPALPWDPADLRATLDAMAQATAVLARPTPELLAAGPDPWDAALDGPLNKGRSGLVVHERAAELVELETRFVELTPDPTALIHGDFRLDNVAIDRDGRAWLCDWSYVSYGPVWFDLVTLLLSVEASGLDPDAVFFAHPAAASATGEELDAALGAIACYYVYSGGLDELPTSPALRGHQRYYARLTLRWLGRRRRWG